jgi:hypothetical protein
MRPCACVGLTEPEACREFVIACRGAKEPHVLNGFSDLAGLCSYAAVDSCRIAGTLILSMAGAWSSGMPFAEKSEPEIRVVGLRARAARPGEGRVAAAGDSTGGRRLCCWCGQAPRTEPARRRREMAARAATTMGTMRTVETMKIQWMQRRPPGSTAAPATMPEAAVDCSGRGGVPPTAAAGGAGRWRHARRQQ